MCELLCIWEVVGGVGCRVKEKGGVYGWVVGGG